MTYNLVITIPLPVSHAQDLEKLQNRILAMGGFLPNVNYNIGITLNHLGRVDQTMVSQLINTTLPRICRRLNQFEISLPFLSSLYKRKEPSPIYLDPQPIHEIATVYETIAVVLNDLKFPQPRRFEPQLVVAYPQKSDPETTKNMLEKIDNLEYTPLPPFTLTHLQIFQLSSTKKGIHYQKLALIPLSQATNRTDN